MTKKLVGLIFFVCVFNAAHGQILDNYQAKLYDGECMFNPRFIERNKIKIIVGKISVKRELQPILKEGTVNVYSFDRKGHLVERIKSFRMRGGLVDSTQDYFKYNDLAHLVSQTTYTMGGYNSVQYTYDNLNRAIKETYLRGENSSPYSYQVQKGKETVLKDESFSYETVNDSTTKKIYYNSSDKAYKEKVTLYNKLGQRKSEETRYFLTNKRESVTYQYDVQGRLSKIIDYSNLLGVQTITYTFDYDEYGNLYSSKIYKNGKLSYTQEFLYYVQTLLLKAQLTKDESSNSIKIIQYEYQYY